MVIFFYVKCQLMHIAYSLRKKSGRLVLLNNALSLMGLGIAPMMILAAVLFENQVFLRVAIVISGVLALSSWVWTIAVYIFKINKHIEFCQNYPVKIETYLNQNEPSDHGEVSNDQLELLAKKANVFLLQIKGRIEEENLQVPDWINVYAQQQVMATYGAICASCQNNWTAKRFSEKTDIKKIFKSKNRETFCQKCGQSFPKEK